MNDWIILGLLVLVISEILFVIFRINFNNEPWILQQFAAIGCGLVAGGFHLLILTEDTLLGEPLIFHWERLVYEFYIICAITIFFTINYFIAKLMDKFAKGRKDE